MNDFPRFDLQGRTALVTGAARGLGNAIALALAHAGADVALGLRDPVTGADLADQIEGVAAARCACRWTSATWTRSARRSTPPRAGSAGSTSW